LYVRDQQAGTTTLVDADTNGVGSGVSAATAPMVTSDGRLVAFTAPDGNLVSDDHNRGYDTFIRDWAAGTTELVSVRQPTFDSLTPNGPSTVSMFSVSQGARYVAFSSEADNLVANDTNGWGDVFVRDVLLGTNILVSAATNGAGSDGPSFEPAISADGSFVAFTSSADNLVPGDLNKSQDVFVRALQTGATSLVSVSTNGVSGGTNSHQPWISADGRFVLFRSAAVNLAPGTAAIDNLFLRDLQIGATYALTTAGVECAAMTPDGRYVVFYGGLSATFRLYVWDAQARQRVYTNTASGILNVAVSPGGKVLAYATASQLSAVNWATNASWSIVPYKTYSFHLGLRFSADERWLAYATADGSVTNPLSNVYLYDLQARTNLLISQSYRFPRVPNGASDSPDMSSDGRYVAYRSAASDIVPGDGNGVPDLYVYDRLSGTTSLISIGRSGNSSADNRSLAPVFSGDAQSLVFQSWASDLVPQDFNSSSDVFVFGLNSPGSLSPFQIQALPGTAPGLNPILTWPASVGRGYRGQYKDRLDESSWHDLNGGVTVVGNQGYLNDASSGGAQRYYRVVAF
jgi:Tol biopolymer transport system component